MCPHKLPLMFLKVFIPLIALNTENLLGNYIFFSVKQLNFQTINHNIIPKYISVTCRVLPPIELKSDDVGSDAQKVHVPFTLQSTYPASGFYSLCYLQVSQINHFTDCFLLISKIRVDFVSKASRNLSSVWKFQIKLPRPFVKALANLLNLGVVSAEQGKLNGCEKIVKKLPKTFTL